MVEDLFLVCIFFLKVWFLAVQYKKVNKYKCGDYYYFRFISRYIYRFFKVVGEVV